MKHLSAIALVGLMLMVTSACSVNSRVEPAAMTLPSAKINYALFESDQVALIDEQAIFHLTDEQKQQFLTVFHQELSRGTKPHKALYYFLEQRLSSFSYHGETYVAEKAMRLNKGNCMSLAILTTALAQVVGLEVDYRYVNTLPVFEKFNNLILSSSHVQAVVYDPSFVKEKGFIYFTRPSVIIDYFPTRTNIASTKVVKQSMLSLYYVNIASSALVAKQLNKAFTYAQKAYELDSSSVQVNNLLAVLHRRAGDEDSAEAFYLNVIANEQANLSLLSNYAVLLESQNRQLELREIQQKISTLEDPSPYSWLEQGYLARKSGNNRAAEKYLLKVIDMAPYVHQAYFALYQLYRHQNKTMRAKNILKQGMKWAYDDSKQRVYKGKLYQLKSV